MCIKQIQNISSQSFLPNQSFQFVWSYHFGIWLLANKFDAISNNAESTVTYRAVRPIISMMKSCFILIRYLSGEESNCLNLYSLSLPVYIKQAFLVIQKTLKVGPKKIKPNSVQIQVMESALNFVLREFKGLFYLVFMTSLLSI